MRLPFRLDLLTRVVLRPGMGPEVVPRIWIRLAEVNLGKVRIGHVQGLVHYFLFMGKPANDTDAFGIWRFHTICCLWKKFTLDITQIYCHSFFL